MVARMTLRDIKEAYSLKQLAVVALDSIRDTIYARGYQMGFSSRVQKTSQLASGANNAGKSYLRLEIQSVEPGPQNGTEIITVLLSVEAPYR